MSSLFKRSFQSKQCKEFIELSIKAIPGINAESAKSIYKSIKTKTNEQWESVEPALDCLQRKLNLNVQISVYKNIINNKKDNKSQVIKSAKSHLAKLLTNNNTIQLVHHLENGFNLKHGSLTNKHMPNYKLRNPLHRQRANTHTNSSKPLKNKDNNTKRRQTSEHISIDTNTTKHLNFYLERALTNNAWNDKDAHILCKTAVNMKCEWITIYSMWVNKCQTLLHKYSVEKYKMDLKLYKKSKRRGYKKMDENFRIYEKENEIKSDTKVCAAIGYPFGQMSTVAKAAETAQAVIDGAKRISLMISAGKVIMNDWEYIENEIKSVKNVLNGQDIKVDVILPESAQITKDIKYDFDQRMVRMMQDNITQFTAHDHKTPGNETEGIVKNNNRKKMRYISSDQSESSDEEKTDSGEKPQVFNYENGHDSDSSEPQPQPQPQPKSYDSDDSSESVCNEWEMNQKSLESFWRSNSENIYAPAMILEHKISDAQMDDDMDDIDMNNMNINSELNNNMLRVIINESITDVTPEPEFEPGSPLHIENIQHKKKKKLKKKTQIKRSLKRKNKQLQENKAKRSIKRSFQNKPRKYKPKRRRKSVRKKKKNQ